MPGKSNMRHENARVSDERTNDFNSDTFIWSSLMSILTNR